MWVRHQAEPGRPQVFGNVMQQAAAYVADARALCLAKTGATCSGTSEFLDYDWAVLATTQEGNARQATGA